MSNIPIDKVFGSSLYAKGRVTRLSSPGGTVISTANNGDLLGAIYSYVISNGKVYWMIDAPFRSQTFFVEHNPNLLNLPNKQSILDQIAREAERQKLEDKGVLQYNIDKYLPWIVGGGIALLALPTILGNQNKVSGMKNNKNKTVLLVGAAIAAYFLLYKKKRKAGTPIIESIDEGFVDQYESASAPASAQTVTLEDYFGNRAAIPAAAPVVSTGNESKTGVFNAGGNRIEYVGPFEVDYGPRSIVAGYGKKGNLGALKTC